MPLTDEEKKIYKDWTMIDFRLVFDEPPPYPRRFGTKADTKKVNEIKEYIQQQQKQKGA